MFGIGIDPLITSKQITDPYKFIFSIRNYFIDIIRFAVDEFKDIPLSAYHPARGYVECYSSINADLLIINNFIIGIITSDNRILALNLDGFVIRILWNKFTLNRILQYSVSEINNDLRIDFIKLFIAF